MGGHAVGPGPGIALEPTLYEDAAALGKPRRVRQIDVLQKRMDELVVEEKKRQEEDETDSPGGYGEESGRRGEEMGGVRGVLHWMQRTALQGSPTTLARVTREWTPGAAQTGDRVHPFRKHFEELEIGDTLCPPDHPDPLNRLDRQRHRVEHRSEAAGLGRGA